MRGTSMRLSAAIVGSLLAFPAPSSSLVDSADARGPVVIELFTAQGCSSCPPADRVLSRIGLENPAKVVPLAFHVDYWNQAGWTDPFGAARWSARQEAYGRAFSLDGAYTPQLVVGGRSQLIGSDEARARSEIEADLGRPRPTAIRLVVARGPGAALQVEVAAAVTGPLQAGRLELMVALFENGLLTPVGRGENGGQTLRNDFVVRRLEKALSIEPKTGARGQRRMSLGLKPEWRVEQLGVAAFLQDPTSMWIYGAAVQPPPVPAP